MILSIDTSTTVCSAALHSTEGALIAFYELHIDKSHAEYLNIMIQNLIDNSGFQLSDLKAVALSEGPGSYTGLRIGTAASKGYSYGLKIPMIAVSTLQSMAKAISSFVSEEARLIPMIDARRMEVFSAVYDQNLALIQEVSPVIIEAESYAEFLQDHPVYFIGNGATKCKGVIEHPHAHFIDNIVPSAKYVGELATKLYQEKKFVDTAYFEPFYLKEFQTKPSTKKWL